MEELLLEVRELTIQDIALVQNYWDTRSDEYLLKIGADKEKLRNLDLSQFIAENTPLPYDRKKTYFLIWMVNNQHVGHSNVGMITFGEEAFMHLHMWDGSFRQRGIGTRLVLKSLQFYFDRLQLKRVNCEPNAYNEAPNKALEKVGFTFVKCYDAPAGLITFPQKFNQWVMTRERYNELTTA